MARKRERERDNRVVKETAGQTNKSQNYLGLIKD